MQKRPSKDAKGLLPHPPLIDEKSLIKKAKQDMAISKVIYHWCKVMHSKKKKKTKQGVTLHQAPAELPAKLGIFPLKCEMLLCFADDRLCL
jgi:hypothetical protein